MSRRFFLSAWALIVGILCHVAFVWAVWAMFWGIGSGFTAARHIWLIDRARLGTLSNVILLIQFPLIHSLLLTKAGRKVLARISLDRRLVSTTFALISSLQLAFIFEYWKPSSLILYQLPHPFITLSWIIYVCSWLFLAKTMFDAGLSYQTGALGWWATFRNKEPKYPDLPTRGSFRHVRQPIYLAFFLILWTSPSGSLDRIILAVFWGLYLLIAPLLKERRFKAFFGSRFFQYQAATPYFIPRFNRRKN